jgi:hypothetical protein
LLVEQQKDKRRNAFRISAFVFLEEEPPGRAGGQVPPRRSRGGVGRCKAHRLLFSNVRRGTDRVHSHGVACSTECEHHTLVLRDSGLSVRTISCKRHRICDACAPAPSRAAGRLHSAQRPRCNAHQRRIVSRRTRALLKTGRDVWRLARGSCILRPCHNQNFSRRFQIRIPVGSTRST